MPENIKGSKIAKLGKTIIRFIKEIRMELKKVIWPTREQLVRNTIAVLFACLIVGIIIWILDFGLAKLIELTLIR